MIQNLPQISDHPYRKLIIRDSRSGKTNFLFKLTSHQPDTDQIIYMLKIHMKQNINC